MPAGFNKDRIRVLTEFNGWAFKKTARATDIRAQFKMRFQSARKARDVIDNQYMRRFPVLAQER
jgi:hypothetical protein